MATGAPGSWPSPLRSLPGRRSSGCITAAKNRSTTLLAIPNKGEIYIPEEIKEKSIGVDGNLTVALKEIRKEI